jgi:4-amino-4-deoxy-L-arabinose transferase-like glycosyltransferase
MPPSPIDPSPPWRRDLLGLAAVFGLVFFFQLGDSALVNPDEARYAEIPREMLATGDWVLPRLNGVHYFEKPPLVYWCVAGFMRVFGSDEFAVRATPALFALGGVLLTYAAVRRLHDRATGLASATVLGTSILYFGLGRILILDMAVSVLMSATLFCFILGVREPPGARRRWFFYGLYASAALATLTKGLIGFLVTGAVMFLWLLVFNQWRRLLPLYLPSGAGLFLAIAAPWHALAAQRSAVWVKFYFIHEHWERFTTTHHGRYEPWWYFIPVLLGGLFPWTVFLWPALRDGLKGGPSDRPGTSSRPTRWARLRENADEGFLVVWAAFIFLFFSKSQSKLIPYILPVFPALAGLIGAWLARQVRKGDSAALRPWLWLFTTAAALLGIAMTYVVIQPGVIRHPAQMIALQPNGLVNTIALIAGALAAPWLARRRGPLAALLAVALPALVLELSLAHAQDVISRPGTRELATTFLERAKPGDRVYHYREFFHDFVFYGQREVGTVDYLSELEVRIDPAAQASGRFIDGAEFRRQWAGPGRVWAVAHKQDVPALFGDATFHYHLIAESRRHYLFSNRP